MASGSAKRDKAAVTPSNTNGCFAPFVAKVNNGVDKNRNSVGRACVDHFRVQVERNNLRQCQGDQLVSHNNVLCPIPNKHQSPPQLAETAIELNSDIKRSFALSFGATNQVS